MEMRRGDGDCPSMDHSPRTTEHESRFTSVKGGKKGDANSASEDVKSSEKAQNIAKN